MPALNEREQDQLRRALTLIGKEAAAPSPAPDQRPVSRPVWRGPRSRVAAAVVAAAAICAAIVGENLAGGPSNQADGRAGWIPTPAQEVACTRIIGVGSIVSMRSAKQPHHALLTLDVEDWIKPAHGDKRITVNIIDPRPGETRTWKAGTRMLFYVFRSTDEIGSVRGKAQINENRRVFERALPRAEQTTCPMPKTPPPGWLK